MNRRSKQSEPQANKVVGDRTTIPHLGDMTEGAGGLPARRGKHASVKRREAVSPPASATFGQPSFQRGLPTSATRAAEASNKTAGAPLARRSKQPRGQG